MKITILGAAGRMGQMRARHLIEMGHEVRCTDPAPLPADLAEWSLANGMPFRNGTTVPDGIVIASPAKEHMGGLIACVNAGVHIFIEKPLCLIGETTQARTLLQRAAEKNLVVAVGYNLRFHPKVMAVKDCIAAGKLKPMWGSFLLRQKPVRPLAHFEEEWASHEIDLAMHLMGNRTGARLVAYGENTLRLSLEHGAGNASFVHADAFTDPPRRAFTIVDQDGGSITCDIETDHVQEEHYKRELAAWLDEIYHQKALRTPGAKSVGDGGPLASGEDGLAVIELLERLTK